MCIWYYHTIFYCQGSTPPCNATGVQGQPYRCPALREPCGREALKCTFKPPIWTEAPKRIHLACGKCHRKLIGDLTRNFDEEWAEQFTKQIHPSRINDDPEIRDKVEEATAIAKSRWNKILKIFERWPRPHDAGAGQT